MKNERFRFAAVSCLHVPYHDAAAIDALCRSLAVWELTDFVLLGDLFEAAAVSVHADRDVHTHTLEDEYAQAAVVLEQIRGAVPDGCRLHWLLGNHDDNIQDQDSRRTDARTRSLLHWSKWWCGSAFEHWKQYPYEKPSIYSQRGMVRLGQVCFIHGYQTGGTSDNVEAKRMRYALGGVPHLLVVRGHTHRPRPVTQCREGTRPVHCWYANAGTLGPISPAPHYMRRKDTSEWGAAVVIGSAKAGRIERMRAPEWEARTVPIGELKGAGDGGA